MSDDFLSLSAEDRQEALAAAAAETGRAIHLLEKDVWVVWCLNALFSASFGHHIVFKGGTSLSKGFGIIQRFSEDIDVTYDIRVLADHLTKGQEEPLPENPSQVKKWRALIEDRLPVWVRDVVFTDVQLALTKAGLRAALRADGDCLFIDYEPVATGTGYVSPTVRVEFGAKSTGEPSVSRPIECDAAPSLPMLIFPKASVQALVPERTFWEKATAAHAFCQTGNMRGRSSYARHWHDLTKLYVAGFAASAATDRALGEAVARHKTAFFVEKGSTGPVNYFEAVGGGLRLVPDPEGRAKLEADYAAMIADGLLPDPVDPFDVMMAKCAQIEQLVNTPPTVDPTGS